MFWIIVDKLNREVRAIEYSEPSELSYPNSYIVPVTSCSNYVVRLPPVIIPEESLNAFLTTGWENKRDVKLREFDKIFFEDSGVAGQLKQDCKDYRKALRDLVKDMTDPRNVVWPIPPVIPDDV
jgi:hypothetical protein